MTWTIGAALPGFSALVRSRQPDPRGNHQIGHLLRIARAMPCHRAIDAIHATIGIERRGVVKWKTTVELFKMLAETPDITHVPYRGGGPALTDLIGGQILMFSASLTGQVLELHRSKKLRVLAVTSAVRVIAAPELPTVGKMGFPSLKAPSLWGILAHSPPR